MKAYKLKKVVELVKEYQWDSGENDKEAEQIAAKIMEIFTGRTAHIPFKKIRCEFSPEGLATFKRPRYGLIVGESKDKERWTVIWDGTKYAHSYAKSFITPSNL